MFEKFVFENDRITDVDESVLTYDGRYLKFALELCRRLQSKDSKEETV